MRRILSILSFLITMLVIGQNPYATLEYDSLVIYDFDWQGKGAKYISILDEEGNLPPTVKKSVKLLRKEAVELSERIGHKSSYGQITAACFDPHFGMIYYENGKGKEYITICMSCNFPKPSIEIPARNWRTEENDGQVDYTKRGFSKMFRRYLSDLKKKHGFDHWELRPGGMFDD